MIDKLEGAGANHVQKSEDTLVWGKGQDGFRASENHQIEKVKI